MKTFKINIREILETLVEIEAENEEKAIAIAKDKYSLSETELCSFDLKDVEFSVYEDS